MKDALSNQTQNIFMFPTLINISNRSQVTRQNINIGKIDNKGNKKMKVNYFLNLI